MSGALHGLAADILAPFRLGISEGDYRTIIETIADQLAVDDEVQSEAQREADIGEAEWIVGVLYAAGYAPRRLQT